MNQIHVLAVYREDPGPFEDHIRWGHLHLLLHLHLPLLLATLATTCTILATTAIILAATCTILAPRREGEVR